MSANKPSLTLPARERNRGQDSCGPISAPPSSPSADPQVLLHRLKNVSQRGAGWKARCPAHDDTHPSLDIDLSNDGKVLLCCRSKGCEAPEIVAAVGLPINVLFPPRPDGNQQEFEATYDYRDESHELSYQVVRVRVPPGADKKFLQRKPSGGGWAWKLNGVRRVPYRMPELIAADKTTTVFVCEGEKDCDALVRLGLQATTNPGGAGNWKALDSLAVKAALGDRRVVVLQDNDPKGEAHVADVAQRLKGVAAEVKTLLLPGLPSKGDVFDWLAAGGTAEKLLELANSAPVVSGDSGDGSGKTGAGGETLWPGPPTSFGEGAAPPEFPLDLLPPVFAGHAAAVAEAIPPEQHPGSHVSRRLSSTGRW